MTQSQIQQLINDLNNAASSIGNAGKYGWFAIIQQQYIIGIQELIWAAVLWIMFSVAITLAIKKAFWKELAFTKPEGSIIMWGILAMPFFIPALLLTTNGIGHLINPVGYAINGLLELS